MYSTPIRPGFSYIDHRSSFFQDIMECFLWPTKQTQTSLNQHELSISCPHSNSKSTKRPKSSFLATFSHLGPSNQNVVSVGPMSQFCQESSRPTFKKLNSKISAPSDRSVSSGILMCRKSPIRGPWLAHPNMIQVGSFFSLSMLSDVLKTCMCHIVSIFARQVPH